MQFAQAVRKRIAQLPRVMSGRNCRSRLGEKRLISGHYFDDEQEIGPQALTLLRKVLADLFRDQAVNLDADAKLDLAKELVALFKSGFRSEEELKAMVQRSLPLDQGDG